MALAVASLVAVALAFVRLPYVILSPGPAINTLGTNEDGRPLITVPKDKDHPAGGALSLTAVSVRGGPGRLLNAYDLAAAWVAGDREILPEEAVYPRGATGEQVKRAGQAEMSHSQEDAVVVAERALGLQVGEKVAVGQIPEGSTAAGRLEVGDRILAVGGRPVSTGEQLRQQIQGYADGSTVAVRVLRKGVERTVTLPVRLKDGRKVVGVGLAVDYTLPVPVTIDPGQVGGPSGGLMFSLGVYDRLTPGDLTGGRRIAGTGTISPGGQVGPIGGIHQKVVGARGAGAQWFLAPAANCSEVSHDVPDGIRVVKVETFTQALAGVQAIAAGRGDGLPGCG